MTPPEDVRMVPMTHADLSWLWEGAPLEGERKKALERLSRAFDAAPPANAHPWSNKAARVLRDLSLGGVPLAREDEA